MSSIEAIATFRLTHCQLTKGGEVWRIHRDGAKRFVQSGFITKEEAMARATALAKKNKGKLVIYRKDGSVIETRSYTK